MASKLRVFRVVLPVVFEVEARSEQEAEDKAADTAPDAFAVGVDAIDTHPATEVEDITEAFNERKRRLAERRLARD